MMCFHLPQNMNKWMQHQVYLHFGTFYQGVEQACVKGDKPRDITECLSVYQHQACVSFGCWMEKQQ